MTPDHFSSIRILHCRLRFDLEIAVSLISTELSCSRNPQPSRSSFPISPPPGWLPEMTDFIHNSVPEGEEPTSILIQLEAQWPRIRDCVHLSWVEDVVQRAAVPTITRMVGSKNDAAGLMKVECESKNREGNGQKARVIAGVDSITNEQAIRMVYETYDKYKQQKAERIKWSLKEGTISRVEAKWCCRCKITTTFSEGKCDQPYCQHKRCPDCRDFNTRG